MTDSELRNKIKNYFIDMLSSMRDDMLVYIGDTKKNLSREESSNRINEIHNDTSRVGVNYTEEHRINISSNIIYYKAIKKKYLQLNNAKEYHGIFVSSADFNKLKNDLGLRTADLTSILPELCINNCGFAPISLFMSKSVLISRKIQL